MNLSYTTLVSEGDSWGINIVVEAADEEKIASSSQNTTGAFSASLPERGSLRVPPSENPGISARLFEAFEHQNLKPDALANSPSTISVILKQDLLTAPATPCSSLSPSFLSDPGGLETGPAGQGETLQRGGGHLSGKKAQGLRPRALRGAAPGSHQAQPRKAHPCGRLFPELCPPEREPHLSRHKPLARRREKEILAFSLPASQSEAYGRVITSIVEQIDFRNAFGHHLFHERPSFR